MDKKVLKVFSNNKGVCSCCGTPTYLSLIIDNQDDSKPAVSMYLCNKCIVKMLTQVYDKRDDLIDDMLRDKIGLTLAEISDLQAKAINADATIEDLSIEVQSLRDQLEQLQDANERPYEENDEE